MTTPESEDVGPELHPYHIILMMTLYHHNELGQIFLLKPESLSQVPCCSLCHVLTD